MKGLRAKFNSISLSDLSSGLRALQISSAQRAVLDSLTVSLVLYDDFLINTGNGEYRKITEGAETDIYSRLARTASSLLGPGAKQQRVLLLLPPAYFVATGYSLNISSEKLLRSALSLQVHTLIPAYEEKLMLGVAGNQGAGTAIWFPEPLANVLFERFMEQGVLLGALMPRILALLDTDEDTSTGSELVLDTDHTHRSAVLFEAGMIRTMLCVSKRDLAQDVLAQQWQQNIQDISASTSGQAIQLDDWTGLRRQIAPMRGYAFIPEKAQYSGSEAIRKQQRKWAVIAASILVLVLCLPFISNAVQKVMLQSELEEYQAASAQARESQAALTAMDETWGAISMYPIQDVGEVLLVMNAFIDNALSSFTINKGVVDISGYTQDPALLIEQLSEREEFFDVGQSRSSSAGNTGSRGDRFGVRLNVSNVDFPAYEALYPGTQ